MNNLNEIVTEFNNESINFAMTMKQICPESLIANNIEYLQNIINNNKTYAISQFTIYVLKYKPQIDSFNEKFFLEGDFSGDVKNKQGFISKIFELKNVWKTLSASNKKGIFLIMQVLCYYSQQYLSLQ